MTVNQQVLLDSSGSMHTISVVVGTPKAVYADVRTVSLLGANFIFLRVIS